MENPPEHGGRRRTRKATIVRRRWPGAVAALLPVFACFLGGATAKWAEGIVVLLFGFLLLADPPRVSLGRILNFLFLGVLAFSAISFLPARWFFRPDWRVALTNDFGIALPASVTPQPWVTLGYLASFLAALVWLYYVCAREVETRDVRRELRLFAGGIASLAGLCVALYFSHAALPFWHNERGFGPFPNRNQTANVFAIAAIVILACGYDDIRNGRKRWIAWALAIAVVVAAVVLDFSRAGIVILVAGSGLWLALFACRSGSTARIAVGVSLLLVLLTTLLLFGGKTLERFDLRGTGAYAGMSSELRWLIFRDAFHLISRSPWCGIGLGNFDSVFAIFRNASVGDTRALHPESDWLWFWAEAGWPALLLTVAGSVLLVWRVFPLGEEKNRRFRAAALIGVILFALHGLLDVSAHRVGTAWSAIFLLGAALRRPVELRPSAIAPVVFRVFGVALIAIGAAWTAAVRWQLPLPGSVGAENSYATAAAASRGQNFDQTISETSRALAWTPLDWHLYFLRALGSVAAQRPASDALDDFRRARFLEPNAVDVPFEEGRLWLTKQPTLTLTAWREALRRAGSHRAEVYDHMLALAQQFNPNLIGRLQELASGQPGLAIVYLARANGAAFSAALEALLARDPDLQTLSAEEKAKLFSLWDERGDRAQLAATIEGHPDWASFAWRGVAKYQASKRNFHASVELVRRFAPKPALPSSLVAGSAEDLERSLAVNPRNYGVAFALYQRQRQAGKTSDALVTVRRFTADKESPRYFHFLEAESWADEGNWEQAWNSWQRFDVPSGK
ncbi:MAG: O-antigen ligase family protein [Verrucomicrobiota bacterium]|nr:O-antigen ligase family protein [Verrucomicrobiota bacterium]